MRRALLLLAVSAGMGIASACSNDYGAAPLEAVGDAGDERSQPLTDASGDGADGADGGGFCATRTGDAYCEDFDSLLDVKTLVPEISPNASVALTQSQSVSPPRALAFSLSKDELPPSYSVFRHPVVGDRPVRLELDMFFDRLADTPQTLQSITLTRKDAAVQLGRTCVAGDGGAPACTTFVAVCLFNVDGADSTTCTTHSLPVRTKAFPSVGSWSHVALEARFAEAGHFTLEVDHEVVLDLDTVTYPAGAPPADAPTVVTVGAGVLLGAADVYLVVDNVTTALR